MRVEFPPLCGRDHLAYRSFYAPVKVVFVVIFISRNISTRDSERARRGFM